MSDGAWADYAAAARELDAVRWQEQARTAGLEAGVAEMSAEADRLGARLQEQGGRLNELAHRLRFKAPTLTPAAPAARGSAVTRRGRRDEGAPEGEPVAPLDPATALSRIEESIRLADQHAEHAARRGADAALLPRWSEGPRNLLVYTLAALAVIAAQAYAFYRNPEPDPLLVLLAIPLAGFAVGYAVVSLAGRPRILEGRKHSTSTRLGLFLCLGIGPLAVAVLLLRNLTSR